MNVMKTMLEKISLCSRVAVTILALTVLTPASAFANSILQIQFTGLNLYYDGSALFDGKVANTTPGANPADADVLGTMYFYVDGSLVGSQSTNIGADIYLPTGALPLMGSKSGTGGFIDIFTKPTIPGWGLALEPESWTIVSNSTSFIATVSGSVIASSLLAQSLPFGLTISEPITVSFSTHIFPGNSTTSGGNFTSFKSFGTGEVKGESLQAPEPSSIILLGLGIIWICAVRRVPLYRASGRYSDR
jgi:hypothetical protein